MKHDVIWAARGSPERSTSSTEQLQDALAALQLKSTPVAYSFGYPGV